jgi:hypothetical protein
LEQVLPLLWSGFSLAGEIQSPSRLKPETIRTLIMLKHHLCLKRKTHENLVDNAKVAEGRVDK